MSKDMKKLGREPLGKCLRQKNRPFKGPEAGLCLGVGGTMRRYVWLEQSEQGEERKELRAGKDGEVL